MGFEKGVLEVPDSEDEPMTSSPVEVPSTLPEFRESHLQASAGLDSPTTSHEERNMDVTPLNYSLRSSNAFARDQILESQSSSLSLQLDENSSQNAQSQKQSRDVKSGANPCSSREEYARREGLASRPSQESTAPRGNPKAKASHNLEQLAEAEPSFIDTREALVDEALARNIHHDQTIGTTEAIVETQGAAQSTSSQQHDTTQYDPPKVIGAGASKQFSQPTKANATQDSKTSFAGNPATHFHTDRNGTSPSTERTSPQLSFTGSVPQLEDHMRLDKAGSKPLSDSKESELSLHPDEAYDRRTRNVVNSNDQETRNEYRDKFTSKLPMSPIEVTFRELPEPEASQPVRPSNTLDTKQQAGPTSQMPAEVEHIEDTSDTQISKHRISSRPALPGSFPEHSLRYMISKAQAGSMGRPDLPLPLSKPSTGPTPLSPKKNSQETTIAELTAQRSALLASLAALSNVQDRMEDTVWQSTDAEPTDADVMTAANRIVKDHIKLLHEYNEIKDVGQGLMGLIADQRGVRIVEVQDEFGIGSKD